MIELALILPVLLLITLGTLEFGFAFDHHLTLEYASREGARTGAGLSDGEGDTAVCDTIDAQIIAAVERVLTSPGSDIDLAEVPEIRIYKAGAGRPGAGAGESLDVQRRTPGPLVDGERIDYVQASVGWAACTRVADPVPDSLGVSLTYTYRFRTPFTGLIGIDTIEMHDRTVMPLSPTEF